MLWRAGSFGVVILPPGADDPQTLTGTGPAVWNALARPQDRAELAAALGREFGADTARVRADLDPLLDELVRIGAVVEVP